MPDFLKEYPSNDGISCAKTLDIENLNAWANTVDNALSKLNERIDLLKDYTENIVYMSKHDDELAPKPTGWVKCTDALPDYEQSVLVCRKSFVGDYYLYSVALLRKAGEGLPVSDSKGTSFKVNVAWRSEGKYYVPTYFYAWHPLPELDI